MKFSQLTPRQQATAALEAVRRASAGSRMRQLDAEALQHAASILELFIPPMVDYDKREREFVGPRDLFDHWAAQKDGAA